MNQADKDDLKFRLKKMTGPLGWMEDPKIGLELLDEIACLRRLLEKSRVPIQFALQQSWSGAQVDAWCDLRDRIDEILGIKTAEPTRQSAQDQPSGT